MKWMNLLAAIVVVTAGSTANAELHSRLSHPIEAEQDDRPALLPAFEQDEYFTTDTAGDKSAVSEVRGDVASHSSCDGGCSRCLRVSG